MSSINEYCTSNPYLAINPKKPTVADCLLSRPSIDAIFDLYGDLIAATSHSSHIHGNFSAI